MPELGDLANKSCDALAPHTRLTIRAGFLRDLISLLPSSLDRRLRIGIDGRDGVGKTTLADELAPMLTARGDVVTRVSLDGFHQPRGDQGGPFGDLSRLFVARSAPHQPSYAAPHGQWDAS